MKVKRDAVRATCIFYEENLKSLIFIKWVAVGKTTISWLLHDR